MWECLYVLAAFMGENVMLDNKISKNGVVHPKNPPLACANDQPSYIRIPWWSFPYVKYSEANSSHSL